MTHRISYHLLMRRRAAGRWTNWPSSSWSWKCLERYASTGPGRCGHPGARRSCCRWSSLGPNRRMESVTPYQRALQAHWIFRMKLGCLWCRSFLHLYRLWHLWDRGPYPTVEPARSLSCCCLGRYWTIQHHQAYFRLWNSQLPCALQPLIRLLSEGWAVTISFIFEF